MLVKRAKYRMSEVIKWEPSWFNRHDWKAILRCGHDFWDSYEAPPIKTKVRCHKCAEAEALRAEGLKAVRDGE